MDALQRKVVEFHAAMSLPRAASPSVPDDATTGLRLALIDEEVRELRDAASRRDLTAIADALCDLLYVTFGYAVAAGIDLEPAFDQVHAANMRKAGGGVRGDGKVLKPDGWREPDLSAVLRAQGCEE